MLHPHYGPPGLAKAAAIGVLVALAVLAAAALGPAGIFPLPSLAGWLDSPGTLGPIELPQADVRLPEPATLLPPLSADADASPAAPSF